MEVTKEAIGWNQLFFKAFKLQRIPHQLKFLNPQQQLILLDLSRSILVRRVHSQFTWRRVVQLFGACYCCNQRLTFRFRNFCQIFEGFGFGKFGFGKKVSVSVSKKFGLGKKSRFRFRKKSLGFGFEKIWSQKKISVLVSEKKYRFQFRKNFSEKKVSVSEKLVSEKKKSK